MNDTADRDGGSTGTPTKSKTEEVISINIRAAGTGSPTTTTTPDSTTPAPSELRRSMSPSPSRLRTPSRSAVGPRPVSPKNVGSHQRPKPPASEPAVIRPTSPTTVEIVAVICSSCSRDAHDAWKGIRCGHVICTECMVSVSKNLIHCQVCVTLCYKDGDHRSCYVCFGCDLLCRCEDRHPSRDDTVPSSSRMARKSLDFYRRIDKDAPTSIVKEIQVEEEMRKDPNIAVKQQVKREANDYNKSPSRMSGSPPRVEPLDVDEKLRRLLLRQRKFDRRIMLLEEAFDDMQKQVEEVVSFQVSQQQAQGMYPGFQQPPFWNPFQPGMQPMSPGQFWCPPGQGFPPGGPPWCPGDQPGMQRPAERTQESDGDVPFQSFKPQAIMAVFQIKDSSGGEKKECLSVVVEEDEKVKEITTEECNETSSSSEEIRKEREKKDDPGRDGKFIDDESHRRSPDRDRRDVRCPDERRRDDRFYGEDTGDRRHINDNRKDDRPDRRDDTNERYREDNRRGGRLSEERRDGKCQNRDDRFDDRDRRGDRYRDDRRREERLDDRDRRDGRYCDDGRKDNRQEREGRYNGPPDNDREMSCSTDSSSCSSRQGPSRPGTNDENKEGQQSEVVDSFVKQLTSLYEKVATLEKDNSRLKDEQVTLKKANAKLRQDFKGFAERQASVRQVTSGPFEVPECRQSQHPVQRPGEVRLTSSQVLLQQHIIMQEAVPGQQPMSLQQPLPLQVAPPLQVSPPIMLPGQSPMPVYYTDGVQGMPSLHAGLVTSAGRVGAEGMQNEEETSTETTTEDDASAVSTNPTTDRNKDVGRPESTVTTKPKSNIGLNSKVGSLGSQQFASFMMPSLQHVPVVSFVDGPGSAPLCVSSAQLPQDPNRQSKRTNSLPCRPLGNRDSEMEIYKRRMEDLTEWYRTCRRKEVFLEQTTTSYIKNLGSSCHFLDDMSVFHWDVDNCSKLHLGKGSFKDFRIFSGPIIDMSCRGLFRFVIDPLPSTINVYVEILMSAKPDKRKRYKMKISSFYSEKAFHERVYTAEDLFGFKGVFSYPSTPCLGFFSVMVCIDYKSGPADSMLDDKLSIELSKV